MKTLASWGFSGMSDGPIEREFLEDDNATEGIRLNKAIADSGYCARRKADSLIAAGRVKVDGKIVTEMGLKVSPTARISVDDQPLPQSGRHYLLFHKPVGCITSRKAQSKGKTIYDWLPEAFQSADPAGRLDKDSSGALILSNDGNFLHQITHPRFHLPKIYLLTLDRPLQPADIRTLESGVMLQPEGKEARMASVRPNPRRPAQCEVTLLTGYNRQIRRSMVIVGYRVRELHRIAFGPVRLGSLSPGESRDLTLSEREALLRGGKKV